MKIFHVKVTTASAIGLMTTIVGCVCAIVPPLAPDKRIIIAALTAVIVAIGLIVNAIHALAGANLSVSGTEQDIEAAVKTALARILADAAKPAPAPAPTGAAVAQP
jgi:hypothetical protein